MEYCALMHPTPPFFSSTEYTALAPEAITPARLYLSHDGRIGRRLFWQALLALAAGGVVLGALLTIAGLPAERAEALVNLLLLWPTVAVLSKRWHDRNRSGWWVLILLVPVLGMVWTLVENGLLPGDAQANGYGPPLVEAPRLDTATPVTNPSKLS